jgi:hypothetical protein
MSLEHIAEDKISAELQLYQFFIAKPKFDVKGTDLIAFVEFQDSFKLGRIQSKGRSLIKQKRCSVKIKIDYVKDSFFVLIYFWTEPLTNNFYYFSVDDIVKEWKLNNNNYSFIFKKSELDLGNYEKYLFDINKCGSMRKQIIMNKSKPEIVLLNLVSAYKKQFDVIDRKNRIELLLSEYREAEETITNSNYQLSLLKEILNLRFKYEMEEVPKKLKESIRHDKQNTIECILQNYSEKLSAYIDSSMIKDYLIYLKEED